MLIQPRLRRYALAALSLWVVACAPLEVPFARLAGLITSHDLEEISGLAASHAHQGALWVVEDSGNGALLHALSPRGRVLARYKIEGAGNRDWEDLASFSLDGKHYLLVADTGDNGGQRKDFALHIFEEPKTLENGGTLLPAWTIRARWPDGPRDCEAVVVDAAAGKVLLISKKRTPPDLFALSLARPSAGKPGRAWQEARRIGRLNGVPEAGEDLQRSDPRLASLFPQVTAADLSPDGLTLAVLTYGNVLFYRRRAGEAWGQAVARPPQVHDVPLIPQAEALAWTAQGGGLYATGEFKPAPIFYLSPSR